MKIKGPIIGLMGNSHYCQGGGFIENEKQYINQAYIDSVKKNGGIPILIPYTEDEEAIKQAIDLCDGLLFPGGEDVDPRLYKEQPMAKLGEIKPIIDSFLFKAMKYGMKKGLPILGICKGMQMLNVACKGTLYQDLSQRTEETFMHVQKHLRDYPLHQVDVEKGSYLEKILKTNSIYTNSMHHQSVKKVGQGLKASAYALDGVVEAVESQDGSLVGIQWHPEEMIYVEEKMNLIFKDLVEKSKKYKKN